MFADELFTFRAIVTEILILVVCVVRLQHVFISIAVIVTIFVILLMQIITSVATVVIMMSSK